MKLSHLFEMNPRNMPGPGDYHPGDEDNPRSPDYDPRARVSRGSRPSQAEIAADYELDQKAEDDRRRRQEAAHAAKVTDVAYDHEYPNGKGMASIDIMTGIAADRATAAREIAKKEYVAYHKYGSDIQELPDGRFKFMVKYMM